MQVFDTSLKLNIIHNTETNNSWRGEVWFEGPCRISLSGTQNNYWLVTVRLESIALLQKLQNEIKKKYYYFEV